MIAKSTSKQTKRTTKDETAVMVKVFLPVQMARRAAAHGALLGGKGPRLAIEAALTQYFKNPTNSASL